MMANKLFLLLVVLCIQHVASIPLSEQAKDCTGEGCIREVSQRNTATEQLKQDSDALYSDQNGNTINGIYTPSYDTERLKHISQYTREKGRLDIQQVQNDQRIAGLTSQLDTYQNNIINHENRIGDDRARLNDVQLKQGQFSNDVNTANAHKVAAQQKTVAAEQGIVESTQKEASKKMSASQKQEVIRMLRMQQRQLQAKLTQLKAQLEASRKQGKSEESQERDQLHDLGKAERQVDGARAERDEAKTKADIDTQRANTEAKKVAINTEKEQATSAKADELGRKQVELERRAGEADARIKRKYNEAELASQQAARDRQLAEKAKGKAEQADTAAQNKQVEAQNADTKADVMQGDAARLREDLGDAKTDVMKAEQTFEKEDANYNDAAKRLADAKESAKGAEERLTKAQEKESDDQAELDKADRDTEHYVNKLGRDKGKEAQATQDVEGAKQEKDEAGEKATEANEEERKALREDTEEKQELKHTVDSFKEWSDKVVELEKKKQGLQDKLNGLKGELSTGENPNPGAGAGGSGSGSAAASGGAEKASKGKGGEGRPKAEIQNDIRITQMDLESVEDQVDEAKKKAAEFEREQDGDQQATEESSEDLQDAKVKNRKEADKLTEANEEVVATVNKERLVKDVVDKDEHRLDDAKKKESEAEQKVTEDKDEVKRARDERNEDNARMSRAETDKVAAGDGKEKAEEERDSETAKMRDAEKRVAKTDGDVTAERKKAGLLESDAKSLEERAQSEKDRGEQLNNQATAKDSQAQSLENSAQHDAHQRDALNDESGQLSREKNNARDRAERERLAAKQAAATQQDLESDAAINREKEQNAANSVSTLEKGQKDMEQAIRETQAQLEAINRKIAELLGEESGAANDGAGVDGKIRSADESARQDLADANRAGNQAQTFTLDAENANLAVGDAERQGAIAEQGREAMASDAQGLQNDIGNNQIVVADETGRASQTQGEIQGVEGVNQQVQEAEQVANTQIENAQGTDSGNGDGNNVEPNFSAPATGSTTTSGTTGGEQTNTGGEQTQGTGTEQSTGQTATAPTNATPGAFTVTGEGDDCPGMKHCWFTKIGDYQVEKLDRSDKKTFPKFKGTINKFLLHTIEGRYPAGGDYEGGTRVLDKKSAWPHFIIAMDNQKVVKIGQYLPLSKGGRAVKKNNGLAGIQVEVGAKARLPFTANHAGLTRAVATLWKALNVNSGGTIPISADPSVKWSAERGAWKVKMKTYDDLEAVTGLVGHQHMPKPDTHWDPGQIDPNVLIRLANAGGGPAPSSTSTTSSSAPPTSLRPQARPENLGSPLAPSSVPRPKPRPANLGAGTGVPATSDTTTTTTSGTTNTATSGTTTTTTVSTRSGNPKDFQLVPAPYVTRNGYGKPCNNNQGTCRFSHECDQGNGYIKNQCPGRYVCCNPGVQKVKDDGTCGPKPANENWHPWGGKDYRQLKLCFPLRRGSLLQRSGKGIRWEEFGSARSKGKRCHAGVDIYTQAPGALVAVDDGKVIKVNNFMKCKSGWAGPGQSILFLVYHPRLGVTINYGEVDAHYNTYETGDFVKRGQTLGRASHCHMLHFEVYLGETLNTRWYPPSTITRRGQCANDPDYYKTKPRQILDGRKLLKYIACKYCDENGNHI